MLCKSLSENVHLPFDKLMALSKAEGPFGRLTALSKVDPSTSLRVDAEQCRNIEGLRYPDPCLMEEAYCCRSLRILPYRTRPARALTALSGWV